MKKTQDSLWRVGGILDAKYLNSFGLPYASKDEVFSRISSSERLFQTVNILGVEYWFTDANTLVIKGNGNSAGSLLNTRQIFGRPFNGTQDVTGVAETTGIKISNGSKVVNLTVDPITGALMIDSSVFSSSEVAAYGVGNEGGSGSGSGLIQTVYNYTNLGQSFDNLILTDTFNAYTINKINSRLVTIENTNFLTGLTKPLIVTALGFTPYDSTNPAGYISAGSLPTRLSQLINDPNYATTGYVNQKVADLVNGAPASLDALNELANALGNDPNFATTVTNLIGTKQPQLNGLGFVKLNGTMVSYDNNSYLPLTGGVLSGNLTTKGLTITNGTKSVNLVVDANGFLSVDNGIYSNSEIAAYGIGSGGSGGGLIQTVYGLSGLGGSFNNSNLTDTFNAYAINQINSRLVNVENGSATSLSITGSGNAITSISKTGNLLTATLGNTFQPLSSAVNAGNIGSQSVNYATIAGNSNSLSGIVIDNIVYGSFAGAYNSISGTDMNLVFKAGFYNGSTITNAPNTGDFGFVNIPNWAGDSANNRYNIQIGGNIGGNLVFRSTNIGGAGTWKTILDNTNFTTANYIQNNPASAQSASVWVNGSSKFDGDLMIGGVLRTNYLGSIKFAIFNSSTQSIFQTVGGYDMVFQPSGSTSLTLFANGAATFASSVTATRLWLSGTIDMANNQQIEWNNGAQMIYANAGILNFLGAASFSSSITAFNASFNGNVAILGNSFLDLGGAAYNNIAVIRSNWAGAGYWGFGNDGGHTLRFDQVSGQSFQGATDVQLKLGVNTVFHSGNSNLNSVNWTCSRSYVIDFLTTQNSGAGNQIIMNGPGSYWGAIQTIRADVWGLGRGTGSIERTIGNTALTWDASNNVVFNGIIFLNSANYGTNSYHELNRNALTTENMFKWSTNGAAKWYLGQRSVGEEGFSLWNANNGTQSLYFNPSGAAFFASNITAVGEITAYSASDIRLKSNIKPIVNSLDIINQLNPVSYNWNAKAKELNSNKTDKTDVGLIAQELAKVLPTAVHGIYDDKFLGVDYIKLTPFLIGAVKELSEDNKDLRGMIKGLIAEINTLKGN